VKGTLTGVSWIRGALQTVAIGGVAAVCAFIIARWVSG
jgi:VIT1/CCC1 family predicted Fe2+/Mn2+ transporter